MNRKEKRDRKNANHRRNEKRRGMVKSRKLFGPAITMLEVWKMEQEIREATEKAWQFAYDSGAFGLR